MAKTKAKSRVERAARAAVGPQSAAKKAALTAKDTGKSTNTSRAGRPGDTEKPLPAADRLKSIEEENLENNPEGTRLDGTTARHTEPLGVPAPGQGGRPGPERRVQPQSGMGDIPEPPTEEEARETLQAKGKRLKVTAVRMGYYDNVRRREGDVFFVYESDYSPRWMRPVDGDVPVKVTSNKQALKRHHDETLAARAGQVERVKETTAKSSGDEDVLSR